MSDDEDDVTWHTIDIRPSIWAQFAAAAVASAKEAHDAAVEADKLLMEYDERWPRDEDAP